MVRRMGWVVRHEIDAEVLWYVLYLYDSWLLDMWFVSLSWDLVVIWLSLIS